MAKRKVRVRRSREEARQLILEAAAQRLQEGGPEAVRVQHVAADLGITDAAVHHHFGSRQGLLEALLRFAGRQLRDALTHILDGWDGDPEDIERIAELIAQTYATQGFSRLALWLVLNDWESTGNGLFEPLVDALHRARTQAARAQGQRRPRRLDTQYGVALLNVALAAEPIFGSGFLRSVGLEGDSSDSEAFRRWLVSQLSRLLTQ